MGKSIEELTYEMQGKARKALAEMKYSKELQDMGVEDVIISESKRSLVVQMAYYSRGRMDVADVKRMYQAAGLYAISDDEAKVKNTWTLQSKHIEGKAIDFVPVKDGKAWWNAPDVVWEIMGEIGEKNGLKWGGRWTERDLPHFEI